jgi:hypothetical protein
VIPSKKGKKKRKKSKKVKGTKVILMPDDTASSEDAEDFDEDDESGMYLEKDDVRLIYNALKEYKPTEKEDLLHSTLLESFEEMLVVDYGVKLPGFEFMDEEEN